MRYLKKEIKKNNLFLYNCVIWIIKGIKQRFCRRAKHAKFFSRTDDGSSLLGSQMHEPRIFIWTNEGSNYKKNGIDTGRNRQVDIRYHSSYDDRYNFTFDKYIYYDIFTLITVHTILASAQCFETWLQHWMKRKISPCFWNQWPAIFRYIKIHNYNWLSSYFNERVLVG